MDGFAAALPASGKLRVLDNGAGHNAKAVRWPSNVVPVLLPPYSPELNPMERLWRDLNEQWADVPATTIAGLSDALGAILQRSSPVTYFVQAVDTVQKVLYG